MHESCGNLQPSYNCHNPDCGSARPSAWAVAFCHDLWRRSHRWPIVDPMRLKSSIWVAAYLRRCQTEGIFGAVRRRGAEEAGAVFVKVALLDGNAMLFAPAPQTVYDDSRPVERSSCRPRRSRCPNLRGRTSCQGNPVRSRRLDRRDRGPGRAAFSGSGEGLTERMRQKTRQTRIASSTVSNRRCRCEPRARFRAAPRDAVCGLPRARDCARRRRARRGIWRG